jgi:hypothetical protein
MIVFFGDAIHGNRGVRLRNGAECGIVQDCVKQRCHWCFHRHYPGYLLLPRKPNQVSSTLPRLRQETVDLIKKRELFTQSANPTISTNNSDGSSAGAVSLPQRFAHTMSGLRRLLSQTNVNVSKDLTRVRVFRGPAFTDDDVDKCGVVQVERIVAFPVLRLDQVLVATFVELGRSRIVLLIHSP